MSWIEYVDAELEEEMIAWRRHLHAHPELGFEEHRTTEYITGLLETWGLAYSRPLETGAVVPIGCGRPGPVIAVRADIDALPIAEENDFDFASQIPGRMHACGHDGHTAILLGLAKVLSEVREQVRGEVRLIFQPAEETNESGACKMVEAGVLDGVDVAIGLHLGSDFETGMVSLRAGPIAASADQFRIRVIGSAGHAAHPHKTVDPLVIAASLVGELQTLVSRRVDPLEPAVVSVGTFHAGSVYNAIADHAELTGTVRTHSEPVQDLVEREISSLATGHARALGGDAEVDYQRGSPIVINDGQVVDRLAPALAAVVGSQAVVSRPPSMGGEDFAYFARTVPSAFFGVGARNPAVGASFPHHHPRFTIDERALGIGLRCFIEAIQALQRIPEGWRRESDRPAPSMTVPSSA